MKIKVTSTRKARTRFDKRGAGLYGLSVEDRRKLGILGADHLEYDRKHATARKTRSRKTFFGLFNRRTAQRGA